jgi:hypothetical protein
MSDGPLTVGALDGALAKFHREVLLPDIQRVVGEAMEASERRLRDEMQAFHDLLVVKLDRLEAESAAAKIRLEHVEDQLAG